MCFIYLFFSQNISYKKKYFTFINVIKYKENITFYFFFISLEEEEGIF